MVRRVGRLATGPIAADLSGCVDAWGGFDARVPNLAEQVMSHRSDTGDRRPPAVMAELGLGDRWKNFPVVTAAAGLESAKRRRSTLPRVPGTRRTTLHGRRPALLVADHLDEAGTRAGTDRPRPARMHNTRDLYSRIVHSRESTPLCRWWRVCCQRSRFHRTSLKPVWYEPGLTVPTWMPNGTSIPA